MSNMTQPNLTVTLIMRFRRTYVTVITSFKGKKVGDYFFKVSAHLLISTQQTIIYW